MLAAVSSNNFFTRSFENVNSKVLLDSKNQYISEIVIAPGEHLETSRAKGREETLTVIKGNGTLEIGDLSQEVTPDTLFNLVASKTHKIFNNSKEAIRLCFSSVPSDDPSDEIYIRNKAQCKEIKTGNKERIYELFGIYGNGPAKSHSIALVEIDEGGSSTAHYHPVVEESYMFIDGLAKLIIGDKTLYPKPGEAVSIPVGVRHQVINIGKDVLRLIAPVTPPWTTVCGIYETTH